MTTTTMTTMTNRTKALLLTATLATISGCGSNMNDPDVCSGQSSCVAIKLTGNVGTIDQGVLLVQAFDLDGKMYIQRADTKMHDPVTLPIILPFTLPLTAPYDDALLYVSAFVANDGLDRGLVSFSMSPSTGTQKVTAPITAVEDSPCYNGFEDTSESDVDCGNEGSADFSLPGYSSNVIALKDRCFLCAQGKKCLFNENCQTANCDDGICGPAR